MKRGGGRGQEGPDAGVRGQAWNLRQVPPPTIHDLLPWEPATRVATFRGCGLTRRGRGSVSHGSTDRGWGRAGGPGSRTALMTTVTALIIL